MPYDVVVGRFNPLALPVVLDFEPAHGEGPGHLRRRLRGRAGLRARRHPGGHLRHHPTAANAIEGSVGPTVRLALRFLRPTLTEEEAVFEGWVTGTTDRRIFSQGRIVQGGIVTVEAEGEFAIFNHEGVHRMASARRRTFDSAAPGRGRSGGAVDAPAAGTTSQDGATAEGGGVVPTGE